MRHFAEQCVRFAKIGGPILVQDIVDPNPLPIRKDIVESYALNYEIIQRK